MLKKWWLLLGFPCGPTTEIQIWSVLELNLQKSCRKKLARVPPSLAIFRFIQKNGFCIFVIAQNGTLPFCDCTKWHIAILWLHKKPLMSILETCDCTKWHIAILWLHKMALCHFVQSQKRKILIFPKQWTNLLMLDIDYIYFEDCNDQVKGRGS